MERLRGIVQRRPLVAAAGLSALLCASKALAQTPDTPSPAPAAEPSASPAELVAARELFQRGTEDADAGHFAEALEKFKRVAAVKETAAVRFNLARCEEAVGKTGAALADFELAEREGRQDPKAEDVGKLARSRADALRPRVPRLTLVPPSPLPQGMAVSLDGGKLTSATLGVALPIDPGPHVVEATAPSSTPFHAELMLAAGEARSVTLSLAPATSDPGPADHPTAESGSGRPRQATWGWITLVGGGLLAVGSGVFFILHDNAVSTVNADCPNQRCPASQETSIDGTESNARTYEAVSIGLIAASALAIGGGIVLLATAPRSSSASMSVTAGAPGAPAGLSLHGEF